MSYILEFPSEIQVNSDYPRQLCDPSILLARFRRDMRPSFHDLLCPLQDCKGRALEAIGCWMGAGWMRRHSCPA